MMLTYLSLLWILASLLDPALAASLASGVTIKKVTTTGDCSAGPPDIVPAGDSGTMWLGLQSYKSRPNCTLHIPFDYRPLYRADFGVKVILRGSAQQFDRDPPSVAGISQVISVAGSNDTLVRSWRVTVRVYR